MHQVPLKDALDFSDSTERSFLDETDIDELTSLGKMFVIKRACYLRVRPRLNRSLRVWVGWLAV